MTSTKPGRWAEVESRYPLKKPIGDRGCVRFAPLHHADEAALLTFYRALPPEVRLRLRQDNTHPLMLRRFLDEGENGSAIILGARRDDDEAVVGEITMRVHAHGWLRQVGEVRHCILPDWIATGLAEGLVVEVVEIGVLLGLDKLYYQVLEDQTRLRQLLENVGFVLEAKLKDHATDLVGRKHNVLILSNHLAELWRKMEDMILGQYHKSCP